MSPRTFRDRAEAAGEIVDLERLAREIDNSVHPDGERLNRELVVVDLAMRKAISAEAQGTLDMASIVSLARAFPLWSGVHLIVKRFARQNGLVQSLTDVSRLLGCVNSEGSGADQVLLALRDAAIPFLRITDETSVDELAQLVNMLHRLNVPPSIHHDLAVEAGKRGANLCSVALEAVQLAKRLDCTAVHNILLEQFAQKLGVDGMNPSIALELLRGISGFDVAKSGRSASCVILRLMIPSLSVLTEDEKSPSLPELCELASFVQDPDRDGAGSEPAQSAIVLAANVGTVYDAMMLARSFRVESGAHSVLRDFIGRNRSPNMEGAILLASMVRSHDFGGDGVLAEIASDCQKNGWEFDPVEFTRSRMRDTSSSMPRSARLVEILLGEGPNSLDEFLKMLHELDED